jgi:hypothetical protein
LLDEVSQYQIRTFSSQNHGRGIKKKTDHVTNDNFNKVNEIAPIYTQTNQSKLKTTPSINVTTESINISKNNVPTSITPTTNSFAKQENLNTSIAKTADNQNINPHTSLLNTEIVQKAVRKFAENLQEGTIKEILMNYPLELKGKETITLFLNHADYESAIGQVKQELLAFLQQYLANPTLQFNLRKPYTDSEKLYFLKQKYRKVNELVDKLGLDLI